jgi:hypothetical protein
MGARPPGIGASRMPQDGRNPPARAEHAAGELHFALRAQLRLASRVAVAGAYMIDVTDTLDITRPRQGENRRRLTCLTRLFALHIMGDSESALRQAPRRT